MRTVVAQSNFWQLISHADAMTMFVLFLLFGMSVFCWTAFLYKLLLWRAKRNHLRTVITRLNAANTIDEVLSITAQYASTTPGYFLSKVLTGLKALLVCAESTKQPLGDKELALLEHLERQTQDDIMYHEERILPVISACVTIAPLLGLMGTVWGLINAFMGISQQQSADIAAVAPGIAQALIATVGGLFVAIPAYVIYTYLSMQARTLEQLLMALSDRFLLIAQSLFVQKKGE